MTDRQRTGSAGTIFGDKIASGDWRSGTSVCGKSSDPVACTPWWSSALPALLDREKVRSVVDFGCGDWAFSRLVDWRGAKYTGIDCVQSLVDANIAKHSRANVRFRHVDSMLYEAGPCDLLIVKDVFIHWPNEAVSKFIASINGVRLMVVFNSVSVRTNTDIEMGGFRSVDIRLPPFGLKAEKILEYPLHANGATYAALLVRMG